jgi:HSP20 family molecular chaperone IbpA
MSKEKNTNTEVAKQTNEAVELKQDKPVLTPSIDIFENEGGLTLYADMPGVDEKNIDITLEEDVLTIIGEQSEEKLEGYKLLYNGYRPGIYRRAFTLGIPVDRSKIKAVITNGVLTLQLPKAEAAKPRKIEVKAG